MERCYFAVLEGGALPRLWRMETAAARLLLEEQLAAQWPVELESLAIVFHRTAAGAVIACGVEEDELRALGPDMLVAVPAALPAALAALADPGDFNLLTGPRTPLVLRRLRRKTVRAAAAFVAVAAVLLWLGLERRAAHNRDQAARVDFATVALATPAQRGAQRGGVVNGADLKDAAGAARVLRALRLDLESTRGAMARAVVPPDAAGSLAAWLSRWPEQVPARTSLVTVTPGTLNASIVVPDAAVHERLTTALGQVPGWTLTPPRLTATREGISVQYNWQRAGGRP